jgi:hypothetical protein
MMIGRKPLSRLSDDELDREWDRLKALGDRITEPDLNRMAAIEIEIHERACAAQPSRRVA